MNFIPGISAALQNAVPSIEGTSTVGSGTMIVWAAVLVLFFSSVKVQIILYSPGASKIFVSVIPFIAPEQLSWAVGMGMLFPQLQSSRAVRADGTGGSLSVTCIVCVTSWATTELLSVTLQVTVVVPTG